MSTAGRSAIPTESPSSIQNPTPKRCVRRSRLKATSRPRPRGAAIRTPVTDRARSSHAGRETWVAMREE